MNSLPSNEAETSKILIASTTLHVQKHNIPSNKASNRRIQAPRRLLVTLKFSEWQKSRGGDAWISMKLSKEDAV